MLEKVDLKLSLSKADYKARMPGLQLRLLDLQRACWREGIASMVVLEGWDASGKGSTVRLLAGRLEPRGFKLYAVQAPRTAERHMPWLWRFWLKVPNYGEMAIFDRSWYGRVLVERVEKLTPKAEWSRAFEDITDFERALTDDGYVIIKFFLHISKAEQKKRFKALEADPMTAWQVEPEDWEHHRKYAKYLSAVEEVLARTETEWAPWTIVEATDRRWARLKVVESMVRRLEGALLARGKPLPPPPEVTAAALAAGADSEDEGRHEPAPGKRARGKGKAR